MIKILNREHDSRNAFLCIVIAKIAMCQLELMQRYDDESATPHARAGAKGGG